MADRKLKRARLLERVRTVEKLGAARASAEAEALSSRLFGVAEKTRRLASHYAGSEGLATAADLARQLAMRQQLHVLGALSDNHFHDAQRRADAALVQLGDAERKRSRIEGDRRELERVIGARIWTRSA